MMTKYNFFIINFSIIKNLSIINTNNIYHEIFEKESYYEKINKLKHILCLGLSGWFIQLF